MPVSSGSTFDERGVSNSGDFDTKKAGFNEEASRQLVRLQTNPKKELTYVVARSRRWLLVVVCWICRTRDRRSWR